MLHFSSRDLSTPQKVSWGQSIGRKIAHTAQTTNFALRSLSSAKPGESSTRCLTVKIHPEKLQNESQRCLFRARWWKILVLNIEHHWTFDGHFFARHSCRWSCRSAEDAQVSLCDFSRGSLLRANSNKTSTKPQKQNQNTQNQKPSTLETLQCTCKR